MDINSVKNTGILIIFLSLVLMIVTLFFRLFGNETLDKWGVIGVPLFIGGLLIYVLGHVEEKRLHHKYKVNLKKKGKKS